MSDQDSESASKAQGAGRRDQGMGIRPYLVPCSLILLLVTSLLGAGGCESMLNGYLDPTALGSFSREKINDIRGSLSINDPPSELPGSAEPTPEDLVPYAEEYRVNRGDFLEIRIYELRASNLEDRQQVQVDELGMVGLPIIGRVQAAGLTVMELERQIADVLAQKEILRDAQVTVAPLTRRGASYTIFGFFGAIQTSSRFGPGTAFIPEPNFRLLEALAISGGLDERVQEVWIYRKKKSEPPPGALPRPGGSGAPSAIGLAPVRPAATAFTDLNGGRGAIRTAAASRQDESVSLQPAEQSTTQPSVSVRPTAADEPPEARGQETQELIEAITGKTTQPAESEELGMRPQTMPGEESTELAPRPGPRWIYNREQGIWIPIEEGPTPTTEPRPGGPAPPFEVPPGETVAEPTIDWEAVAGIEDYRIIRIPADLLGKLDPRYNIVIRSGDVIRLKAEVNGIYYLAGQVARPGAFGIAAQKITLKAAIAAAGGLAPLAWPDRCTIYRRYGGREEMIQVNLDRIFAGRDPDFYIKPDDLINIGSHPAAVFLATARNAFRMFYGFGFVYDRNFADIDSFGSKINPDVINERAQRFPGLFQSANR